MPATTGGRRLGSLLKETSMKTISTRSVLLVAVWLLATAACIRNTDAPSSATITPATEATRPSEPAASPAASAPADAAPTTTPAHSTGGEADEQAINDSIDRVLGDHAGYQAVLAQLQRAVAGQDAAAVAALVAYPFTASIDGRRVQLDDAAAFAAQYDRIVTPAIAGMIAKQKYADVMVSARGVMLGSGEVWLNGVCGDRACAGPEVKVIAIQPGAR
jgi:hypothetical protein